MSIKTKHEKNNFIKENMKQKRGGVEQKRTWKKGRGARTIYGGVIAEGRGLYTVVGGRSSRATW